MMENLLQYYYQKEIKNKKMRGKYLDNTNKKNRKTYNEVLTVFFVESPGIEPGSKQATKKLSTRLFPD